MAFQAGSIPIMPDWLVHIIRRSAVHYETRASDHGDVHDSHGGEREQAWASAALEGCICNLSSCQPGGRNNALNATAYRLGRIIGRGWLKRSVVERQLLAAANHCGLTADDGVAAVNATIRSGLNAGIKVPAPDLRERSR
jgi:hypothetical protein